MRYDYQICRLPSCMELRHLRYFAAVAELLSFRRAAQRLHVSQPTLTRQVQDLEEELGVRLLERNRRREVALTAAGRSYLADAQQVLGTVAAAKSRALAAERSECDRLDLANIAALSTGFLPGCLRAFRAEFPRVEVRLFEMERTEQLAAVREGRIHLGLLPYLDDRLEPDLASLTVWTCPMVAVLPAGHALATKSKARGGGRMHVRALADEVLIVLSAEGSPGYLERLDRICGAAGFHPASVRPVDGAENVLGMVGAGYGVAILPEVLVAASIEAYTTRRLHAPVDRLELKLVWPRKATSKAAASFLAVAKRCVEANREQVANSPNARPREIRDRCLPELALSKGRHPPTNGRVEKTAVPTHRLDAFGLASHQRRSFDTNTTERRDSPKLFRTLRPWTRHVHRGGRPEPRRSRRCFAGQHARKCRPVPFPDAGSARLAVPHSNGRSGGGWAR